MPYILQLLRPLITLVLALLLVFEEWGWEPLAAAMARLAKLPLWAWMERRIARLSRWGALCIFVVPMLALLPVKVLGLYLLGHGHVFMSMGILIGAKIIGTAIVARLFQLTLPALMLFAWFAHWYPRWKVWKDQLIGTIRQSFVWRAVRRIKADIHRTMRRWWSRVRRGG